MNFLRLHGKRLVIFLVFAIFGVWLIHSQFSGNSMKQVKTRNKGDIIQEKEKVAIKD